MNKNIGQEQLNKQLLSPDFVLDSAVEARYQGAQSLARYYAEVERALVVLSDMVRAKSYICYGRLGQVRGLQTEPISEEVESIWEQVILEQLHPEDLTDKIAWELCYHAYMLAQPQEQRPDYYLQHFLRFRLGDGSYVMLRHRIYYLAYDLEGHVSLSLCLYTMAQEQQGLSGIFDALRDQRIGDYKTMGADFLSPRECEVLGMIAQGLASKQIADRLQISTNTVNNHRQNILRKLHCQNSAEAVGVARKLGLIAWA